MSDRDRNECVTVRCNNCREEYCFFPMRVIALRSCKCGNDDFGSPLRDWSKDDFGNFTLIAKEILAFGYPPYWEG